MTKRFEKKEMKIFTSNFEKTTFLLAIAVISLIGCCSFGAYSKLNPGDRNIETNQGFTSNDSIVFDIIEILLEEKNLSGERKKEIEKKIEEFPSRVVRRDTSTFYLQTVLGIAYNEFVTEDYDIATNIANSFTSTIEEADIIHNVLRYSSIKFTPSALKTKAKHKNDSIPELSDIFKKPVSEFEYIREKMAFMADIFEELPMNLNIETYIKILNAFKQIGGAPAFLNSTLTPGFYHHCKMSGREDVLDVVKNLWGFNDDCINTNNSQKIYRYENPDATIFDFDGSTLKGLKELSLSISDAEGNIQVIDSLISINQADSIGKYVDNYQNLKYQRGENRDILKMSVVYEECIPETWKPRFYNYWGLALLALGEYKDAEIQFSKAIQHKTNRETFSGAVLNYAMAIAESGNYNEALKIYESQKEKVSNLSDSISFLEGLGYIYSLFNPEEALKYYTKIDSIVEKTPQGKLHVGDSYLTRHYVREARLMDSDLFRWREALRNARFYSGEDSNFNFYGTIHNALYHSEMGRYRNFLFDFEGAAKDFENARKKIENLDSADYRVKWWNQSWQSLRDFGKEYSSDKDKILNSISLDRLSPLHKIWLVGDLVAGLDPDSIEDSSDITLKFINDNLQSNLGEVLMALSSDESKFLLLPVSKIQELLMSMSNLQNETRELARLNLFRKGLLQTSKVEIEKGLMSGNRKADYDELKDLRKRLNHSYIYEDSLKIKKLLPQVNTKERELYYSLKDSLIIENAISTNPESICLNLKKNDLAIDFIEYNKNDSVITGAFIFQPDGNIKYQELLANETGKNEKVWEKLMPYLKGKEDIYFSPDGNLNNKGIEFYSDENGNPIFLNHRLHRVSHLRNINDDSSLIEGEMAIIGVSDHNSPIGEADQLYRGDWTDLPDVEYEIKLIDTNLNRYPHKLLYNDDAIEENIKAIDGKDISVIHFSTHGVYRSLDSLNFAASDRSHFDHNIALRTLKTDSREISGIILRKGNLTWKMPHLLDDEDDILTAQEIELMNFPNLQLTVLSACDSGLGEINGEGIQGLQRSFRIAGSKNIICSLNKVNDYWSAQFMGELYKNLADGLSIYDSFRNAQLSIKLAAPDNPVAWSSYILIE